MTVIVVHRLRTAYGPTQSKNHIARGDDNEEIIAVQGEDRDIDDMFHDAAALGKEYAVRHIIIAPKEPMTIEAMMLVLAMMAAEFNFDIKRAFVRVHRKARITPDAYEYHLHALVPEYDDDGRVVDSSHNYRRQEKIARISEHHEGHEPLRGKHNQWVIKELYRDATPKSIELADKLVAAFPFDAPAPKQSLVTATLQMLKRKNLSASALREIVRDAWKGTSSSNEFRKRVSAAGMAIQAGTGDPPLWIVTIDGMFLATLSGVLPGVRKTIINERLGDPRDADTAEQAEHPALAPAAQDGAAIAAAGNEADSEPHVVAYSRAEQGDFGKAGRASDAADDDRPIQWDDDGVADADAVLAGAEGHVGGGADAAGVAGAVDRLLPLAGERAGAERAVEGWRPKDLIQISARKELVARNARLAALAAEPERDRIERELTEIEGAAMAEVVAAATPAPPGAEVTKAEAGLGRAAKSLEKAQKKLARRQASLDAAQAAAVSEPWWRRMMGGPDRIGGLTTARDAAAADLGRSRWVYDGMKTSLQKAQDAAVAADKQRYVDAEPFRRQLAVVAAARGILARWPTIAAYGAPTLLLIAYEQTLPTNPGMKDIWGIPIELPRRPVV